MPQQSFRLLHISDLHLATHPNLSGWQSGVGVRIAIAEALGHFKKWRRIPLTWFTGTYDELVGNRLLQTLQAKLAEDPDIRVLITGDVSTVGTLSDLKAARTWLDGNNGVGFKLPAERAFAMPGNHDRFTRIALHSGSKHFERPDVFGARWDQTDAPRIWKQRVNEFRMSTQSGTPGLSIVCADFALPMPRSFKRPILRFDHGHVDMETLDALTVATANARDQGQAVVWGIHFPPNFPGEWFKKLRGYRVLLEQAASLGVNHIFSGHTHEQLTYSTGKPGNDVVVHCAGSAMCYGAPCHGFYGHTIVTLNGGVVDVQSEEFLLAKAKQPVANLTWHQKQPASASHHRVRLPWLRRFGW